MEKILVNTQEKFNDFINEIDKQTFSFDTETTGLNIQKLFIVGMSFCDGNKSWYLPFMHETTEPQLNINDVVTELKKLFDGSKLIAGHNLVYDMQVLKKHEIYPVKNKWFDTMVAQHLIDENHSKSLKKLSEKYFNYKMTTFNEVTNSELNFKKIPIEKAKNYACDDAVFTYRLYKMFLPQLEEAGVLKLFEIIEMPFLRCIVEMEWNGILIDVEKLKELDTKVNVFIKKLECDIVKLLPSKYVTKNLLGNYVSMINLNSPQQLSKLLYTDLNLKNEERSFSVGIPAIKKLMNEHPIIPLLIRYKKYQKLSTAFIKSLPKHLSDKNKIHCNFLDTGTVTGRLSSSNPNMQQLPNNDEINIRECFIAEPGTKFITLDYSQEELCLTAFLTKDKNMLEAFDNGFDLHLMTANKIFNLGLNGSQLNKNKPEYKVAKEKFDKQRYAAKIIVFSILYGAGKESISSRLNISSDEAQGLINNYFKMFPQISDKIKETHRHVKTYGYVKNFFGRRRHFSTVHGYYSKSAFRQSFNYLIQGTAADLLRHSMNKMLMFFNENNDEAKMIFTVHDEITVQVPEERAEYYLHNIKRIMETSLKISPPLIADGNIGNNYSETK